MRLSPKSMMLWIAVFATVGASLALLHTRRSVLPPLEDPPWIPLPTTGVDASSPALRELIASPYAGERALVGDCGIADDADRERYRLQIARNAWEDVREVEIVRRGEWLEIEVRDGFPPAPLEPPRDGRPSPEYDIVQPIAHARIHRRDAEPIRRAWDTQGLWHAEQKPLGCSDGRPVTLEACIDGRYAIRHRNCDADAYPSTQALWDAITILLPKPERAYWRER
ncbi:MAG: hypothetical protein ACOY82_07805 [Pseudomonadota bacterium]